MRAHLGAPRCKTIFQSCQARPQPFKVLSTTMSKHLFAIRGGGKTDIQHNARTLSQSLPILSFFHPVPFSSLSVLPVSCSPPTPPLRPPPTLTPTPLPAAGSCLPPCLFQGVHFPQTLGGRGMLSGGCRQTHMFRTFMGGLTSRRRHSVFSRGQCCLLQRSN